MAAPHRPLGGAGRYRGMKRLVEELMPTVRLGRPLPSASAPFPVQSGRSALALYGSTRVWLQF